MISSYTVSKLGPFLRHSVEGFLTVSSIYHSPSIDTCKRCDIFAIQRDLPNVNHDTLSQDFHEHPKLEDELRSLKASK